MATRRARQRSRGVRLLEALLARGMPAAALARQLHVSPAQLADVRAGRRRMRLSRQLLLAAIAEAREPTLLREVANLRAQLAAVIAYRSRLAGAPIDTVHGASTDWVRAGTKS